MDRKRTLFLIEVAVCAALAYLLDLVSGFIFSRLWPQGGNVSIAMVPVILMAIRWGLKGGLLTGFLFGLLQIAIGMPQVYHPVQGFIDYFLAFTVVGSAGIFSKQIKESFQQGNKKRQISLITAATFIGGGLRFLAHFFTGWIFFGSYAPKGTPAVLYSIVYNATYMVPSIILSIIFVYLVIQSSPRRML
ncbi:energy-coupled thiamine transporter ThiT [Bacillus massilinigeriensis]|uniref:energy-coupled thiamine transporter ThiT n=1 Tax=Bacillus mediterraneensis TaxID=1805474 RepID=UPI0008F82E80|nr:energy-coupled thiamine transporter ThiT [Bacillus mediterraneensis]